ncbi:MAG: CRTAC1 family protein [Akkermansiaceae bacterium]
MTLRFFFLLTLIAQADETAEFLKKVDQLETSTFSAEKEARRYENEGIVPLWDKLLQAPRGKRIDVLGAVPFTKISLGKINREFQQDLGIQIAQLVPGGPTLTPATWKAWLQSYQKNGLEITHTDWHHDSFSRTPDGRAISRVRFTIHLMRGEFDRTEIKAIANVLWKEGEEVIPDEITIKSAWLSRRVGPKAFVPVAVIEGESHKTTERNDMGAISVFDLNGDQLPEVILGNANRVLWNKGGMKFEARALIPEGGEVHSSVVGLIGDFTGDGHLDWLCDSEKAILFLYSGKGQGQFSPVPQKIPLKIPYSVPAGITAGDIDRDGDLDLFLCQWRSLYEKMPHPFWNANDGFGNSLLLNDGKGNFTDATESTGLKKKRYRRSYSASFVDLNHDQHLDLAVVSDFYGLDLFLNDGTGKFRDATSELVNTPYAFGMSHTMADYNRDGVTDFFMLGMGSTTARRLEQMKAHPAEHSEAQKMRAIMGHGNRFYLGGENGRLSEPAFAATTSRTGWSWGSTSFDFDNDGDQDIYVGNGHISGKTTRDYCSNFWCRDIYLLPGKQPPLIASYLDTLPEMKTQSWDGYQVNALLVNQQGRGFTSMSPMLDLGFDFDTRRIISADLDLDGRPDLLVGRLESTSGFLHQSSSGNSPPTLYILKNTLPEAAERNWIGVTLQGDINGAIIELTTPSQRQRSVLVSGDSFMCQHPGQTHFGLGKENKITSIKVTFPNGKTQLLEKPKINTYHLVR